MLLSRACEYAIQAVLYLSEQNTKTYVSIHEIAEKNDIPFHFLGKILQTLTHKNLLISSKGPKGGVCLVKTPEEITLLDIVEAIDGLEFLHSKCIVGLSTCKGKKICALHDRWGIIRKDIYQMFAEKNIAQLRGAV